MNDVISKHDVQFFEHETGIKTAYRYRGGTSDSDAAIVFLPGYMSDMDGGKAHAILTHADQNDRSCLLLDYSGCGQSEGKFADGTLSQWRDEICALIESKISGPVILIGSSMGGWLMLMVAQSLITQFGSDKIQAMMGIAAAPDFTDWDFSTDDKLAIARDGVLYRDNPYGYDPTPMYHKFHQDGQNNRLLTNDIAIDCPIYLFHGQNDQDVPFDISIQLMKALRSSQVHLTLIKDGDHRFSRDQDISLLLRAVDDFWKLRG